MQPDDFGRTMKLVESVRGTGAVACGNDVLAAVGYEISRYQAMTTGGLPIPGLHRIEGTLDRSALRTAGLAAGAALKLTLEDGRTLAVTLASDDGRVLAEGHGPSRCSCC